MTYALYQLGLNKMCTDYRRRTKSIHNSSTGDLKCSEANPDWMTIINTENIIYLSLPWKAVRTKSKSLSAQAFVELRKYVNHK